MTGLIIISIILVLNFIYQYHQYRRCEKFKTWYEKWLLDANFKKDLNQYRMELKSLIYRAGLKNIKIPFEEPIGGGHIRTMTINPIDQFPTRIQVIAFSILRNISAAQGVYKKRMWASINPIQWIEFIIFLPSIILSYLGLEKENSISKIFNVIWWAVGVVIIPVIITTYANEISIFVKGLLK